MNTNVTISVKSVLKISCTMLILNLIMNCKWKAKKSNPSWTFYRGRIELFMLVLLPSVSVVVFLCWKVKDHINIIVLMVGERFILSSYA